MDHIEVNCTVEPGGENVEILIAYLSEVGFTMFEECEKGVKAYINADQFDQNHFEQAVEQFSIPGVHVSYEVNTIPFTNWNEEWESNFHPIRIGDDIYIRAEYHDPDPAVKYELVIQPRMAFGTGHHATTWQVMKAMTLIPMEGKDVLDMGCGTGILGILAAMMGARSVVGIDNDPNAVENAQVNAIRNHIENFELHTGDVSLLKGRDFDIILANINRNIILQDVGNYAGSLRPGGLILFSGFYTEDLPAITEKATGLGLTPVRSESMDNWVCATFVKKS